MIGERSVQVDYNGCAGAAEAVNISRVRQNLDVAYVIEFLDNDLGDSFDFLLGSFDVDGAIVLRPQSLSATEFDLCVSDRLGNCLDDLLNAATPRNMETWQCFCPQNGVWSI